MSSKGLVAVFSFYIIIIIIMYQYYTNIKSYLNTIQEKIDKLEIKGHFQDIPDLLLLREKLQELKQDFYNEEIQDNELKNKYVELEKIVKSYI